MNNDLRQRVIRGLECCIKSIPECECVDDCPYFENCWRTEDGTDGDPMYLDLMKDSHSLLKSQQARIAELEAVQAARVMTLEEVKRLLPGADVWIEYHDLTGWKIAAITVREIFDNGLLGELQSLRYSFDRYGRYNGDWLAWCCWTSRPTDEQREAVKWDADTSD